MATSTEFEGTADSQYKLEFSADNGTTKHKVPILQESDYPEETPVLDDITPTDAHRTVKAKVDFVEDGTVKGQYIYKELKSLQCIVLNYCLYPLMCGTMVGIFILNQINYLMELIPHLTTDKLNIKQNQ